MANAFQKPPFQNNGFQAVFSTNAFQQCAFQYPGFQTEACPEPEETARSGVWRLQLYKLQEADNLRRERERKDVFKEAAEKVILVEKVVKLKPKAKPKDVETVTEEMPPFPVRPIYKRPEPAYDEQLLLGVRSILSATFVDVAGLQPLLDRLAKNKQEQDADEEDIEMLLLAA